jgi:glycosyltransferase involved in cell wall biosynthesis
LAIQPVDGRVTVLIPTLRRYPYLQVLLDQLRWQTVAPFEIIVVDQTPLGERNLEMKYEFSDLPLRWFFLDQAGQCSSRNFGLQTARSEYILFLDDDDEIQPDLIERHLTNLSRYRINISNGVAIEPKAGDLPEEFRILRVSNVFPTNNTMIRRDLLQKSGLFDLAYDHGQRADHDLGMRLYLTGELMVLDPDISVIHHHAPVGGLREHKARVDTYAASRKRLFKQILPSVSDIYLSKRYFSEKQVREKCWIDILGTFSVKGSVPKRFLKGLIALLSMPRNIYLVKQRIKIADQMFEQFPRIPRLSQEDH